jgi:hypothetical protein
MVLGGWSGIGVAAKFSVANNGIDNPTCGSSNAPCRSISQAIAHANAGDTIIIGPGRYGALNGDGTFSAPGDEAAEVGGGCACMIKIDKPLALTSSDGAAVTVLDVGGADISGVVIRADGGVFGQPGRGFTIANARRFGLDFEVSNGSVAGNMAMNNGANGNHAFAIFGNGNTIQENVALGNASTGFEIDGSGVLVSDNVAAGNRVGFQISGSGQFTHNVASSNVDHGLTVSGGFDISRNAVIGTRGEGVGIGGPVTFTENNIFGNGITTGANCGLVNGTGTVLTIPNNFWGAASGPGPDPADAVCGGPTIVDPVATKPFKITVKSGW